jgi:hypothetical protein
MSKEFYQVYLSVNKSVDVTNREIIINTEKLLQTGLIETLKTDHLVILDFLYDIDVKFGGINFPYLIKDDDGDKIYYHITLEQFHKYNPTVPKSKIRKILDTLDFLGLIDIFYYRAYDGYFYHLTPQGRELVEFTIEKTN